uniref:Apolipoprotein D n=1 Tax=Culicoides sonorensis TaxID=179676 RepID=A0A336M3B7_CULSO
MIQIFAIIALACLANAQVPMTESCPEVTVQQAFSVPDYLGKWYENQAYPAIFELTGKCISAEYTLREDGKVGVLNRQINRLTGSESTVEGYATSDPNEPAKLTVVFPRMPKKKADSEDNSNYWVLSTDYKSYSVVWSCSNLTEGGSVRFLWILTRERVVSEEVVQTAYDVLDKFGISKSYLRKTIQTGCD